MADPFIFLNRVHHATLEVPAASTHERPFSEVVLIPNFVVPAAMILTTRTDIPLAYDDLMVRSPQPPGSVASTVVHLTRKGVTGELQVRYQAIEWKIGGYP